MLILSREDKWDHPTAHSPHLHLLLVTIFTPLMEGGCHCCGWIRIWLLTMIYEVLKWIFKWVEKVLVPSWNHKHKCSLLPQKCFSACNISLLLDSKDVFLQRGRRFRQTVSSLRLLLLCCCYQCVVVDDVIPSFVLIWNQFLGPSEQRTYDPVTSDGPLIWPFSY